MTTKNTPAVHIVGWSHSKFGKYDLLEPETLIADAVAGALLDAGLSGEDVDSVVVGTFNGGFVGQDFPSSLAINAQRGGRLPINLSAGLKAKGHPIGATGVSQHVLAAMQVVGEAGDRQLPATQLAAVFNMGGVAVANYASIRERSA